MHLVGGQERQYVAGVPDVPIPTYIEAMLPTLKALEKLGGSGTKEEIDEAVVEIMGLTEEQGNSIAG